MKTGLGGRRRAAVAAAQHEDVGAFPVPASRVLSAITDCEEHHENPGRDYADHIVKAHHELQTIDGVAVVGCSHDMRKSQ